MTDTTPKKNWKWIQLGQLLILTLSGIILYANNFQHPFLLDTSYLIPTNPYVKKLSFIPAYFKDALTLSSLNSNVDYRPILMITYAINFAISQYDTWSYHLFQILLHLITGFGLMAFSRQLIRHFTTASQRAITWAPFLIGVIFIVHPVSSGVVNYISARSSLLPAACLIWSFSGYFRWQFEPENRRLAVVSIVLYTLAIFSKVEAVGALAVYFLLRFSLHYRQPAGKWLNSMNLQSGILSDLVATINRSTLRHLAPYAIVSIVYFSLRSLAMPDYMAAARAASGPWHYFITQITGWWYYVYTWFAPFRLIADYQSYPIFTSVLDPAVIVATSAWVAVAAFLRWTYTKSPLYMMLVISALALISPTSSIAPLAEMVNEHRPYLPLAMLSLSWLIPTLSWAFTSLNARTVTGLFIFSAMGLQIASWAHLTFHRNMVFSSAEAYWSDILKKAPGSRSNLNYGRTFFTKKDYDTAIIYFEKALSYAPYWHFIHINLGIAYDLKDQQDIALNYYNQAVRFEPYSNVSLKFRGNFHLKKFNYPLAYADFKKAVEINPTDFEAHRGAATASAGLGRLEEVIEHTLTCHRIDPSLTERSIVGISVPFWKNTRYYPLAITYYKKMLEIYPDRPWLIQNISTLKEKLTP